MGRTVSSNESVLSRRFLTETLGMNGSSPDDNLTTSYYFGTSKKTMEGNHNAQYRDNNTHPQTSYVGAIFQDDDNTVYLSTSDAYVFDNYGEMISWKKVPTNTVCVRYDKKRVLFFKLASGVISVEAWNILTNETSIYSNTIGAGVTITSMLVFNWDVVGKYHILFKTTNITTAITFDLTSNTFQQHSTYTGSDTINSFKVFHVNTDGSVITVPVAVGVSPGVLSLSNKVQLVGSINHTVAGAGVFSLITGSTGHYTSGTGVFNFGDGNKSNSIVCPDGVLDGRIAIINGVVELYAFTPGLGYIVRSMIPGIGSLDLNGLSGRRKKEGILQGFDNSYKSRYYKVSIDPVSTGITFSEWIGDIPKPDETIISYSTNFIPNDISNVIGIFCDIDSVSAGIRFSPWSVSYPMGYGYILGGVTLNSTEQKSISYLFRNVTVLSNNYASLAVDGYNRAASNGYSSDQNRFSPDPGSWGAFVTKKGYFVAFFMPQLNIPVSGIVSSQISKAKLPIFFPERKSRYKLTLVGGGGGANYNSSTGYGSGTYTYFAGALAAPGAMGVYMLGPGIETNKGTGDDGYFEGNWGAGANAPQANTYAQAGSRGSRITVEKLISKPLPFNIGLKPFGSIGGNQGVILTEEMI